MAGTWRQERLMKKPWVSLGLATFLQDAVGEVALSKTAKGSATKDFTLFPKRSGRQGKDPAMRSPCVFPSDVRMSRLWISSPSRAAGGAVQAAGVADTGTNSFLCC
jgi:hypothetical protein